MNNVDHLNLGKPIGDGSASGLPGTVSETTWEQS